MRKTCGEPDCVDAMYGGGCNMSTLMPPYVAVSPRTGKAYNLAPGLNYKGNEFKKQIIGASNTNNGEEEEESRNDVDVSTFRSDSSEEEDESGVASAPTLNLLNNFRER